MERRRDRAIWHDDQVATLAAVTLKKLRRLWCQDGVIPSLSAARASPAQSRISRAFAYRPRKEKESPHLQRRAIRLDVASLAPGSDPWVCPPQFRGVES